MTHESWPMWLRVTMVVLLSFMACGVVAVFIGTWQEINRNFKR